MQVRGVELDGQTVWSGKYLLKWRQHVQEARLLNPSPECLQALLTLPQLRTLAITVDLDRDSKCTRKRGRSVPSVYKMPVLTSLPGADEDDPESRAPVQQLSCNSEVLPPHRRPTAASNRPFLTGDHIIVAKFK